MPSLSDMQVQLAALETFMSSTAYGQVQVSIGIDLAAHTDSILATAPDTVEAVAFLNRLHGKREATLSWQTYFEGLRDTLKTEIEKLILDSDNRVVQDITEEKTNESK